MQYLSCKSEWDLHENDLVGRTHFHMNDFTQRLVLTQRQKATWKWYSKFTFKLYFIIAIIIIVTIIIIIVTIIIIIIIIVIL